MRGNIIKSYILILVFSLAMAGCGNKVTTLPSTPGGGNILSPAGTSSKVNSNDEPPINRDQSGYVLSPIAGQIYATQSPPPTVTYVGSLGSP